MDIQELRRKLHVLVDSIQDKELLKQHLNLMKKEFDPYAAKSMVDNTDEDLFCSGNVCMSADQSGNRNSIKPRFEFRNKRKRWNELGS